MTPRSGRPDPSAEEAFRAEPRRTPKPTNPLLPIDFGPPVTPWPPFEADSLRRWSYLRCCFRVHP